MASDDPPVMEGAPAWMATFGDMMSLLLCFFVLLLSFASMDVVKFKEMAGSMREALGSTRLEDRDHQALSSSPIELAHKKPTEAALETPSISVEELEDLEMLSQVEDFIGDEELDDVVEAVPGERGLVIRVKGKLMFDAASAHVRGEAREVFSEIAKLAGTYPQYKIAVEGHTDDRPIQTERFPSNWELSTSRAVAGVRFLIDEGKLPPARVSAAGYAHTRPVRALEDRAQNRRLEFVFYRDASK